MTGPCISPLTPVSPSSLFFEAGSVDEFGVRSSGSTLAMCPLGPSAFPSIQSWPCTGVGYGRFCQCGCRPPDTFPVHLSEEQGTGLRTQRQLKQTCKLAWALTRIHRPHLWQHVRPCESVVEAEGDNAGDSQHCQHPVLRPTQG